MAIYCIVSKVFHVSQFKRPEKGELCCERPENSEEIYSQLQYGTVNNMRGLKYTFKEIYPQTDGLILREARKYLVETLKTHFQMSTDFSRNAFLYRIFCSF